MAVEVLLQGSDGSTDMVEVEATLAALPREGEQIGVWVGEHGGEAYLVVDTVTYAAWEYPHDPGVQPPRLWVRSADHLSDDEWAEVWKALREKRTP